MGSSGGGTVYRPSTPMTMTKTLRAIVTEQKLPALGSADDGDTISDAAQWLANQGKLKREPVELDWEGYRYICETTVTIRDFGDFTNGTKSGGTLQSNKDWGIFTTADAARNRCHINAAGGDRFKQGHPFRITGPHSDSEPNKSPGYVLEQQCGIWAQSVTEVESIGCDIDHVWGDFFDIGFLAKDPRRTAKCKIIPGRWSRCGRVGFNAGGTAPTLELCGDGTPNSYIERVPGDCVHCEIQGAAGDIIDWNVHDLVVKGAWRAHLSGMHRCDAIRIHNNIGTTEFFVQIVPASGERADLVLLQDNHWSNPGGGLCNIHQADTAVVTGNVGPVPGGRPMVSTDGSLAVMRFGGCKNITTSPNDLTRV